MTNKVYAPTGGRKLVKQSDAAGTDINRIVNRWRQTGIAPVSDKNPEYGDFSGVEDFHSSMNRVKNAEREFLMLPARVRAYCKNDPGEFLDLCLNPERIKECEDLGLKEAQLPEKALLVRMEAEDAAVWRKSDEPEK